MGSRTVRTVAWIETRDLEEADHLACQFEHFTSADVSQRLSEFLDNPTVCFHGDPIPPLQSEKNVLVEGIPLSALKIGQSSTVIRVEADQATTKFLADGDILPGVQITVIAVSSSGEWLIEAQENRIHILASLTKNIIVTNAVASKESNKEEQTMTIPLSNLKVGETGIIQKLTFKGAIRQRLMAMGLVRGETIQVKRVAPMGDPIDFVIKGYDISLRKSEAKEILVTPVQAQK